MAVEHNPYRSSGAANPSIPDGAARPSLPCARCRAKPSETSGLCFDCLFAELLASGRFEEADGLAAAHFGPSWHRGTGTSSGSGTATTGPNWGGVAVGVCVGGGALLISLATMSAAQEQGGAYIVLWGAVLWGGYKALRSLAG